MMVRISSLSCTGISFSLGPRRELVGSSSLRRLLSYDDDLASHCLIFFIVHLSLRGTRTIFAAREVLHDFGAVILRCDV